MEIKYQCPEETCYHRKYICIECECDGPDIENLERARVSPLVGPQYAVKHECNNAIPLPPPFTMRGERKVSLAGDRIYMGCLVNQESRVIGHEVYGGENGRGARVSGV